MPSRICVPVCVSSLGDLPHELTRAAEFADIIELRLDCLAEQEFQCVLREPDAHLAKTLAASPRPVLLTLRPGDQGGKQNIEPSERILFWTQVAPRLFQTIEVNKLYGDIELDLLTTDDVDVKSLPRENIICSQHDFTGVPADLEAIYERTKAAGITKVALQANTITDCLPAFNLLQRARNESRPVIAIAMGAAGLATRVLAGSYDAFLTFAALDRTSATAPGQPTALELRDLYRFHSITKETIINGIIGAPVSHSASPHMHNRGYAAQNIDADYLPFEVDDLDGFMRRMVHPRTIEMKWNLRGLSVTAPHKQTVMPYLDWIDTAAREIGAVNTVVIQDGELHGYNTDAEAAITPLEEQIDLNGAHIAVLGAGGAARAVLWSLRRRNVSTTVFARDAQRARATAEDFSAAYDSLPQKSFAEFDVVINTTPLGTHNAAGTHSTETPATSEQLRGVELVYDLVYNPPQTRFMQEGICAGCRTLGGRGMLVRQAGAQWTLWTGTEAPLDVMRDAVDEKLKQRN